MSISSVFSALTAGTHKTAEGIIAVDNALLGYAKVAVNSYIDLGRKSVSAKSVSDLFDLQVAHAHDRVEQRAANAREVIDPAQRKMQDAYAPIKDVFERAPAPDAK